MARLNQLLKENTFSLVVLLSGPEAESAQAAQRGGADALMVSLPDFSGLKEQKSSLKELMTALKIPVGIRLPSLNGRFKKEVKSLLEEKIDFVETAVADVEQVSAQKKTSCMARLAEDYAMEELLELARKKVEMIDAAIIPRSRLGRELTVGDLQQYITIVISSALPVIVPTTLSIQLSEVAIIWDTGAKGILLTPEVLGNTPRAIEKKTREFRTVIDDLSL